MAKHKRTPNKPAKKKVGAKKKDFKQTFTLNTKNRIDIGIFLKSGKTRVRVTQSPQHKGPMRHG